MVTRCVVIAVLTFAVLFDLAREGIVEQQCRQRIHELKREIEWAEHCVAMEQVRFQDAVFAPFREPVSTAPELAWAPTPAGVLARP